MERAAPCNNSHKQRGRCNTVSKSFASGKLSLERVEWVWEEGGFERRRPISCAFSMVWMRESAKAGPSGTRCRFRPFAVVGGFHSTRCQKHRFLLVRRSYCIRVVISFSSSSRSRDKTSALHPVENTCSHSQLSCLQFQEHTTKRCNSGK